MSSQNSGSLHPSPGDGYNSPPPPYKSDSSPYPSSLDITSSSSSLESDSDATAHGNRTYSSSQVIEVTNYVAGWALNNHHNPTQSDSEDEATFEHIEDINNYVEPESNTGFFAGGQRVVSTLFNKDNNNNTQTQSSGSRTANPSVTGSRNTNVHYHGIAGFTISSSAAKSAAGYAKTGSKPDQKRK